MGADHDPTDPEVNPIGAAKAGRLPPVPQNWKGPEWIEIDGTMLPFVFMSCECPTPWLICTAYGWGRCKRCGTRPEVKPAPGQPGIVSGPR